MPLVLNSRDVVTRNRMEFVRHRRRIFGVCSFVNVIMKEVDKADYFATVCCTLHCHGCLSYCCRSPLKARRSLRLEMEA